MPRATYREQYSRHLTLHEIWRAMPMALVRLDARSQVALASFYEPHRDHTFESLGAHQRHAARLDPSLPHRAGKAYALLMRLLPRMEQLESRPRVKGEPYEVRIFAEPNLNIDAEQMAKLLVRLMQERTSGHEREDDRAA